MTDIDPVGAILGLAALALALGTLHRYVVAPAVRMVNAVRHFLEDWNGQPERPGHDRVPGVVEQIRTVRAEVTPNGGGSMKDALRRVEDKLDGLEQRAEQLTQRADTNARNIEALKDGQAEAKDAAEKAAEAATDVDQRLTGLLEESQVREQTYLASLSEMGIDLDPQPPVRDPSKRTRHDDHPEDQ